MTLVAIGRELNRAVNRLRFDAPVAYVYNPLSYARKPHETYLKRYGQGPKEALFLGMNPGPFGMAQTGVPFGDVAMVRDWLGIEEAVAKPPAEHPKRPVMGFGCTRSEVSGTRLWTWARDRFKTPEQFFERFFVVNYCPLAFMEESGRNRTPDKLPIAEREPLLAACDRALQKTVALLEPKKVIGVGAYARKMAERCLQGSDVQFGTMLHPSPASPKANRGWVQFAEANLVQAGIKL